MHRALQTLRGAPLLLLLLLSTPAAAFFRVIYYDNPHFSGDPVASATPPQLDFGNPPGFPAGVPSTQFSFVARGQFMASNTNPYVFCVNKNAGTAVRVVVGGRVVIELELDNTGECGNFPVITVGPAELMVEVTHESGPPSLSITVDNPFEGLKPLGPTNSVPQMEVDLRVFFDDNSACEGNSIDDTFDGNTIGEWVCTSGGDQYAIGSGDPLMGGEFAAVIANNEVVVAENIAQTDSLRDYFGTGMVFPRFHGAIRTRDCRGHLSLQALDDGQSPIGPVFDSTRVENSEEWMPVGIDDVLLPSTAAYVAFRLVADGIGSGECVANFDQLFITLVATSGTLCGMAPPEGQPSSGFISDGPGPYTENPCVTHISPDSVDLTPGVLAVFFNTIDTLDGPDTVVVDSPSSGLLGTYSGSYTADILPIHTASSEIFVNILPGPSQPKPQGFIGSYLYLPDTHIDKISPAGGTASTIITLTGRNLGSAWGVNLESTTSILLGTDLCLDVEVRYGGSELVCRAPVPQANGQVIVSHSLFDVIQSPPPYPTFTYIQSPTLDPLVSQGSFTVGVVPGAVLTVRGTGFGPDEGQVRVTVDDLPCPILPGTFSQTELQCTTALSIESEVPVDLRLFRFETEALPSTQVYAHGAPSVSLAAPPAVVAGANLDIFGSNLFSTGTTVEVGGELCGIIQATGSYINCNVRANVPLGSAAITVTRFQAAPVTVNGLVDVVEPPTIMSISPAGVQAGVASTVNVMPESTCCTDLAGIKLVLTSGSGVEEFVADSSDGTFMSFSIPATLAADSYTARLKYYNALSTNTQDFFVIDPPTATAVTPGGGGPGARVTLTTTGTNGFPAGAVFIDIAPLALSCPIFSTTSTTTTCTIPATASLGVSSLSLFVFGVPASTPSIQFNIISPVLTSVSPLGVQANTVLSLNGDFGSILDPSQISVTLGINNCPLFGTPTPGQVQCTVPPLAAGSYAVTLAHYGTITNPVNVEYVGTPVVTSVSPRGGIGNQVIQISGSNFGTNPADIFVNVGASSCTNIQIAAGIISCTFGSSASPAGTDLDVVVTRFGIPSTVGTESKFLYIQTPTITDVSPEAGVPGSEITVSGVFAASPGLCDETQFSVVVGTLPCPLVPGSLSGACNSLACTIDVGLASGEQPVALSRFQTQIAQPFPTFSVAGAPYVSDVIPSSGRAGDSIVIQGIDFGNNAADLTVVVGGVECDDVRDVTPTSLTCIVPALNTPGLVTIRVERFGLFGELGGVFTAIVGPQIETVLPRGGYPGAEIVLSGSNFGSSTPTVTMDGMTATVVSETSVPRSVTVAVPNGVATGTIDIVMTSFDGLLSSPVPFVSIAQPLVSSVSPSVGSAGTPVQIFVAFGTDADLLTEGEVAAYFGANPCTGVTFDSTKITCSVPPGVPGATVNVAIKVFDALLSAGTGSFQYDSSTVIAQIDPPGGPVGTELTIEGGGFGRFEDDLDIRIAGIPCPIVPGSLSAVGNRIVCTVPSVGEGVTGPQTVELRVIPTPFYVSGGLSNRFYLVDLPTVSSISPTGGVEGTELTISGDFGSFVNPTVIFVDPSQQCAKACEDLTGTSGTLTCTVPHLTEGFHTVVVRNYAAISATFLPFEYIVTPTVASVRPSGGSVGSLLTISGTSFGTAADAVEIVLAPQSVDRRSQRPDGPRCELRDSPQESQLTCTVPDDLAPGLYDVFVYRFNETAGSVAQFEVAAGPIVAGVQPAAGLPSTPLIITGTGFGTRPEDLIVRVAGQITPIVQYTVSDNSLLVLAPSAFPPGQPVGDITVSRFGVPSTFAADDVVFRFISQPVISQVSPTGGVPGTLVNLTVANLAGDDADGSLIVRVGDVPAEVRRIDPANNFLQIVVPETAPLGLQGILLAVFDVVADGILDNLFEVILTPLVAFVEPPGGVVPLTLTIVGQQFGIFASALSVSVGGNDCAINPITLNVAGSYVECHLASTDGFGPLPADVPVVLSRYGATPESPVSLTVFEPPEVLDIFPEGGEAGVRVTVSGQGFGADEAVIEVTVGGVPCPVVPGTLSDDELVCEVDDAVPGSLDVVVERNGFEALSDAEFVYVEPPQLVEVDPLGGQAGDELELSGLHFGDSLDEILVTIGGVEADLVPASLSGGGTRVRVVVPSGPALGEQPVRISVYGVEQDEFDLTFEYVAAPTVQGVNPIGGIPRDQVLLTASPLGIDESALEVLFGDENAPIVRGSLLIDTIQFKVPDGTPAGVYPVRIERYGVVSSSAFNFTVIERPSLLTVSPSGGDAGAIVVLNGTGLGDRVEDLSVVIGGETSEIRAFDAEAGLLTCVTPAGVLGVSEVRITRFEVQSLPPFPEFNYVNSPDILTVSPRGGAAGTEVALSGRNFGTIESAVVIDVLVPENLLYSGPAPPEASLDSVVFPCPLVQDSIEGANGQAVRCVLPTILYRDSGEPFVGTGSLRLTNFGVPSGTPRTFSFVVPPVLVALSPEAGAGGDILTLLAEQMGTDASAIAVSVGLSSVCAVIPSTVNANNDGQVSLQCLLPNALADGTTPVVVSYFGLSSGPLPFVVEGSLRLPQVARAVPLSVSLTIREPVYVVGNNLFEALNPECVFNSTETGTLYTIAADHEADTFVICEPPLSLVTGDFYIQIRTQDGYYTPATESVQVLVYSEATELTLEGLDALYADSDTGGSDGDDDDDDDDDDNDDDDDDDDDDDEDSPVLPEAVVPDGSVGYNNNENDFPVFKIQLRDNSGQRVPTERLAVEASVLPEPLDGVKKATVLTNDDGLAVFDEMNFRGEHGVTYNISFVAASGDSDITVNGPDIYVLPCESLRANSVKSDAGQDCLCVKGHELRGQECLECPANTYKSVAGNQPCTPCGANEETTGDDGADSADACICQRGFFLDLKDGECKACELVDGLQCPGGVGTEIPQPGFWLDPNTPDEVVVHSCLTESACTEDGCRTGHEGPLCEICQNGFGRLGSRCLRCGGGETTVLVLVIVVTFVVFVVYQLINTAKKKSSNLRVLLKVLVNFVQVLALLRGFDIRYPNLLGGLFEASSAFNVSTRVFFVDCNFSNVNYYARFAVLLALPVITMGILFVVYLCKMVKDRYVFPALGIASESLSIKQLLFDYQMSLMLILYLLHPSIVREVLVVFQCTKVGSESFLTTDFTVSCNSDEYKSWRAFALVYFLTYCCGLLVVGLVLVRRNHSIFAHKDRDEDNPTLNKYRFLLQGYTNERYYWEFVVLARKLGVVAIGVFFAASWQLFLGTLLFLVAIEMHRSFKPIHMVEISRLEHIALWVCAVTLMSGTVFNSTKSASTERLIGAIVLCMNLAAIIFFAATALQLVDSDSAWIERIRSWMSCLFPRRPRQSQRERATSHFGLMDDEAGTNSGRSSGGGGGEGGIAMNVF